MPTISSMLHGTYLMYKYNQKNGENIFNSSSKSTGLNSLWNNFSSSDTLNSSSSTLSGLLGIRSNVSSLVKDYNTTRNTFNNELNETLDDLKKSTNSIKNLDFNVGEDALTSIETTNDDGSITTTSKMNDKLTDVVNSIKDFADNYNDTIKFFSDNSSVSKQVKNMSNIFSDMTYNSGSASKIGIKLDSNGKMTVDEDKLAQTITKDPTKVKAVLSTLTNKTDRHVSFARSQQNRMFPSMQSMLGSSLSSASVYSGKSLIRLSNYSNVGNLLNYFV